MRVRIVVADQAEASFYDMERFEDELQPAGHLTDPQAHLHDRDLGSDRPGRVFDHAPPTARRRGAVAHHGTGGERSPRKHEAAVFAHRVARELEHDAQQGQFERLVIMAAPTFLGMLREALPSNLAGRVVTELHKDLVHASTREVRRHIPREAFRPTLE
jgi:protein required for attachment to host cells